MHIKEPVVPDSEMRSGFRGDNCDRSPPCVGIVANGVMSIHLFGLFLWVPHTSFVVEGADELFLLGIHRNDRLPPLQANIG